MTNEQQNEIKLYDRWYNTKEKQILEEYAGRPIEEVPEEYREKIAKLREFGLGKKEKTTYEQVIEFLEHHNGELMKSAFREGGKSLKRGELTQEQRDEVNLHRNWENSKEKQILDEYAGRPTEEVPEEYREKIAKLREFGLGKREKTTYEQVIEFLEHHNGKLMSGAFSKNGRSLKREEMKQEQIEEINLYKRWKNSAEFKILEEYAGRPIEEVPEEYREKIAKLREFGLGLKKSKLSNAKKQRDDAKTKNNKAKELEGQVEEQLKKRGKKHEEQ